MLKDSCGRSIKYLRISVTDRCNLKCFYCSFYDFEWLPQKEILSYEEIEEVARAAVELGVTHIRLTGGEPLLRKGFTELVKRLSRIKGLEDLSLTTNGILLGKYAVELKEAGLKRVNVSLDTLRPERFKRLTGKDLLEEVLSGIRAALGVGLEPVKINTVVIRGFNEDEVEEIAALSIREPLHVRFIEFMPVGDGALWGGDRWVPSEEVKRRVESLGPLEQAGVLGLGPARVFRFPGAKGTVGFISAMSEHFCGSCNRIRLTPEGKLRYCLFSDDEFDLRPYIAKGREALKEAIARAVALKPATRSLSSNPKRIMRSIGG